MIYKIDSVKSFGSNDCFIIRYEHIIEKYNVKKGLQARSNIIEINSIEELASLQKDCIHPIIIDGNEITIYDDWIE